MGAVEENPDLGSCKERKRGIEWCVHVLGGRMEIDSLGRFGRNHSGAAWRGKNPIVIRMENYPFSPNPIKNSRVKHLEFKCKMILQ